MENNNSISVLTLNIQGLRSPSNRSTLFSWLNCVKADVICLQETHSTSVDEFINWISFESDHGNNLQHYSVVSSPGSARSSGVAILYKPSLKLEYSFCDDAGRLVVAHLSDAASESSVFQVVNIYGPNRRQLGEEFFTSILPQMDPSLPSSVVISIRLLIQTWIECRGGSSSKTDCGS